jgi:hypothetical protein
MSTQNTPKEHDDGVDSPNWQRPGPPARTTHRTRGTRAWRRARLGHDYPDDGGHRRPDLGHREQQLAKPVEQRVLEGHRSEQQVARDEGAAVVEFVLVLLILLPLFVAILQLGLALYVRNTLAACAQEGARYGADADFVAQGADVMTAQAADRTTACINSSVSSGFSQGVTATTPVLTDSDGVRVNVVEVQVASPLPVIGFFSLGSEVIHVKGDAMQELP